MSAFELEPGAAGAAGATGPTGLAGLDGLEGASGDKGVTGATGVSGATGATGVSGATGATGVSGATGATGVSGATGATGVSGATGATGVSGATGATGSQGLDGLEGPSGGKGVTGATGVSGATGATGVSGATGATGVSGATGATGVSGATGATGISGATGATGVSGATGATGVSGATGAQGLDGLEGPSGDKGATGAGATGATGVSGATGATGVSGATGAGATGATGSAGLDGLDGLQGPTGPSGGIQYAFSTTTTDADPGNGFLRLSNATQNASTTIRADLLDRFGNDWTAILDTFDDSSSNVKGIIRLVAEGDTSKFLTFSVSALAAPAGYRNITVTNLTSSSASPFADGSFIRLQFDRVGDRGLDGIDGIDGARGATGPSGSGATGATGISGATGATGAKASGVIYLSAQGLIPATTNGAQLVKNVEATNVQNYYSLDFDTTTQEIAHAIFAMPSDWDAGTVTFEAWWTASGVSTNNVQWEFAGRSYGDSETLDQAYGTPQVISDAHTATALQAQKSGATPATTFSGTPAAGELVAVRVRRDVANDNLAVDAKLIGIVMNYSRT